MLYSKIQSPLWRLHKYKRCHEDGFVPSFSSVRKVEQASFTSPKMDLAKLAVDKPQSSLAILATITLVRLGVVAIAAVWIRSITVRLNLGRGRALESSWARCELSYSLASYPS